MQNTCATSGINMTATSTLLSSVCIIASMAQWTSGAILHNHAAGAGLRQLRI